MRRELLLPIRHSIHGLHLFHASLVQKSWGCKNDNNGYELVLCVQFRTITIMNGSSENPVHTEKLQLMFWFIVRKEKWKGLSTYITFEHIIAMYDLSYGTISITIKNTVNKYVKTRRMHLFINNITHKCGIIPFMNECFCFIPINACLCRLRIIKWWRQNVFSSRFIHFLLI